MRRFALTFLMLMAAWILITGSVSYEEIVLGTFVSLAVAQMIYKLAIPARGDIKIVDGLLALLKFLIVLFVEEIKAHIFVLKAIVTGKTRAGLLEIEKPFKSEIANYFVLNGITLTPGTFTLEVNDRVLVHCMDVRKSKDAGSRYAEVLRGAFK